MHYEVEDKSERKMRNYQSRTWMLGMERFSNPEDLRNKYNIY